MWHICQRKFYLSEDETCHSPILQNTSRCHNQMQTRLVSQFWQFCKCFVFIHLQLSLWSVIICEPLSIIHGSWFYKHQRFLSIDRKLLCSNRSCTKWICSSMSFIDRVFRKWVRPACIASFLLFQWIADCHSPRNISYTQFLMFSVSLHHLSWKHQPCALGL